MSLLIENARVYLNDTEQTLIYPGHVLIRDGLIQSFGEGNYGGSYTGERIDAEGRLLIPGLVNMHGHFYGAFSRGMNLHDKAPKNFMEVLERLWWRLDRALDEEAVRLSTQLVLAQAIRCGVTTIIDHHASPSALGGSLNVVADACRGLVRISTCYEVTDRNGPEECAAGIAENIRFLRYVEEEKAKGRCDIHGMMGLHACLTCPGDVLEACKKAVSEAGLVDVTGYHVHVAEGEADVSTVQSRDGCSPVQLLHRHGMTGPQSLFVHCVHISEEDMDIIAETGTVVVHNPSSNMNNAVGVTPVLPILSRGITLCLGTDGMWADMLTEYKSAYLIHKLNSGDPQAGSVEMFNTLFHNNPAVASQMFGIPLGIIAENAAGDVLLLDYYPPTPMTGGNIPWHVMFGIGSGCVSTTVLGGKVLMREHKLLAFDEAEIMRKAREHAPIVHERVRELAEKESTQ